MRSESTAEDNDGWLDLDVRVCIFRDSQHLAGDTEGPRAGLDRECKLESVCELFKESISE